MKQLFAILSFFALPAAATFGQTPDDAIRQSYQIPQGTARNMAVGGAGGSLGGDLSSAFINPAGLGFYKTGEVVLSPGFNLINTNFNFRETGLKDSKTNFTYGPIGLVYGWQNRYEPRKSSAFSLSVNQVANFNSVVHYRGFNNVSSWTEQYLEELIRNRVDTGAAYNLYPFGSSLAFDSYLIDGTYDASGQLTGYKSFVPVGTGINQENEIITRGGIHEINLGFPSNNSDKVYFGASVGIPIYSYHKDQTYTETDATNNLNNDFSFFTYNEQYKSTGVGVNLKLGLIVKPIEKVRLGIALHSPTFANMTDEIRSRITANTEGNASGTRTVTSDELNNNLPGQYRYTMTTPWKAIISGTYILNEVSDIRRQKGFITADVEYVRQQATQYSIIEGGTTEDDAYYKTVNDAIDARYKGNFNVRVGGELKFNVFMVRAGYAFYGNPYRQSALSSNRNLVSAGVGYRNKGIFVDLTAVQTFQKDTHVPYYLSDPSKPNTSAMGKNRQLTPMLTVGFKF
jgi:hypothetical protein